MSPVSMIRNGYSRDGDRYIAVRKFKASTGWSVMIVRDLAGKLVKHVTSKPTRRIKIEV